MKTELGIEIKFIFRMEIVDEKYNGSIVWHI